MRELGLWPAQDQIVRVMSDSVRNGWPHYVMSFIEESVLRRDHLVQRLLRCCLLGRRHFELEIVSVVIVTQVQGLFH